jgi:cytochrome P450
VFATPKHEIHRRRRAAINRYFSKTSITKMEPHIHDLAQTLCSKLLGQKSVGKPFELPHAYSQFTTDVITSYCFGETQGFLEEEGFDANLRGGVLSGCFMLPVAKQWPQMFLILDNLPQ